MLCCYTILHGVILYCAMLHYDIVFLLLYVSIATHHVQLDYSLLDCTLLCEFGFDYSRICCIQFSVVLSLSSFRTTSFLTLGFGVQGLMLTALPSRRGPAGILNMSCTYAYACMPTCLHAYTFNLAVFIVYGSLGQSPLI